MLVKDQLRVRMEQLGVSVTELAKRLGVSAQSVRHWLTGRSFPGKRHVPDLEKALSFRLDFSEGDTPQASPTVESTLQASDIELFMKIAKLPPMLKKRMYDLVDEISQQVRAASVADLPAAAVKHSTSRSAGGRSAAAR